MCAQLHSKYDREQYVWRRFMKIAIIVLLQHYRSPAIYRSQIYLVPAPNVPYLAPNDQLHEWDVFVSSWWRH